MENDSIRASGNNTLVDLWIEGKLRALSVSSEAIGACVGYDRAAAMSEEARSDFVRTHLPLVIESAKASLARLGADAETLIIDQLARADGRASERRKGDRRNGERRKAARPKAGQPERRRSDRRTGERRKSAKRSDA